jgi:SAM-dependent methyltransferase
MSKSHIDIVLAKNNLDGFVIRKEIFKAVYENLFLFKGKVLDSGCGSMPYKEFILSNNNVTDYVGLDIESAIDYQNVKPDFLWDGITMPFQNDSFDIVISTEVLEHVPNPDIYLAEVKRVLKPGGSFFFTVPFLMSLHEIPHDYYRYTPYALELIFKRVGFTEINIKPMGGYNAAMAHMMGLWVNKYLWGRKKKIMGFFLKPVIGYLYKKDKTAINFNKPTMMVGLKGTVIKP